MLNHDWIAAHIPHQGSMCLLDSVLEWDAQHIVCNTLSHTDLNNPLRSANQLGAANGVEYAAQAMAIHGALLTPSAETLAPGYLTSVRGLSLYVDRLDNQVGPLRVTAERLSGDTKLILYQFYIHHGARCLIEGRASVVLNALAL